jgi:hypothetical protein
MSSLVNFKNISDYKPKFLCRHRWILLSKNEKYALFECVMCGGRENVEVKERNK